MSGIQILLNAINPRLSSGVSRHESQGLPRTSPEERRRILIYEYETVAEALRG